MRVLIVDDSDLRLIQLRALIEQDGYEVVAGARDGAEAVERFQALRPDLVIMDLIMPRMNGLDAMRAMLQIDPAARIVIASSMRSPESALECQRNGARFYLHKPYEPRLVQRVLKRVAEEVLSRRGKPVPASAT